MSQIPRAQYAVKKQQQRNPFEVDHQNGRARAAKTLAAEKISDNLDNEVLILDDHLFDVAEHEEVIAEMVSAAADDSESAADKRKRSRKSKDSTESKDSDRSKKTNGSSAESKILKASFEDFTQKQRRARADRLQNASTIVNLSTVSTSESAIIKDDTISSLTPTAERRTSGRRSTRPIDEIKFEYRTPDLDDSLNVSTNATLGSVGDNESLLTTPGTDRKRPLADYETMESPKRSRLDLSGLFNSFSSPVTLLRNRFKRANIASTPIAGGGDTVALNDSLESLEELAAPVEKEQEKPTEVEQEEELHVTTTPIKKRACIVM